jgi:hypothetical protein
VARSIALSGLLIVIVVPGNSAKRDFALDVPGIHVLTPWRQEETWMAGIADKFTQSAQEQTAMPGHDGAKTKEAINVG